jgi:VanZ family protein
LTTSTSNKKRRSRFIAYAPLIVWIGLIFFLSSSQGSLSETSRIIRPILEFLFPSAPPETISYYHGVIRKFAHFTEYAVLSVLAVRTFSSSPNTVLRKWATAASVALVFLVAISDETAQSFNAARTGSAIDVLIDIAGGITALGGLWALRTLRKRRGSSSHR